MKTKTILIYGLLLAVLVIILKILEYRFFVRELSAEIYIGLVALLFTSLGVWLGLRLIHRKTPPGPTAAQINTTNLKDFGISEREAEVLQLMSQGLSNQQIADKLFVSLNTIKTHCTNIYSKLGVNKRTQAIHLMQQIGFK